MVKALDGATVAVTGAAGFVGARTVEHLILGTGCRVRALVRSFHRLGRLSELPQERLSVHEADILDAAAMARAFRGCDVVVHCAYGNEGTAHRQWQTTVEGTRVTVGAALTESVSRFVHISPAAVHDCSDLETFDEAAPKVIASGLSYEGAKLVAVGIVGEAQIASIVLRPTVIYGAWGKDWTERPVRRLIGGVRGLPSGAGKGVSNAVYIDDVVQAIIRSGTSTATGPVLVASDETVTWGDFYDGLRAVLSPPPPERGKVEFIESWEEDLYRLRAKANIERARQLLGYAPRVSFAEGSSMVAVWSRWFGLLPPV